MLGTCECRYTFKTGEQGPQHPLHRSRGRTMPTVLLASSNAEGDGLGARGRPASAGRNEPSVHSVAAPPPPPGPLNMPGHCWPGACVLVRRWVPGSSLWRSVCRALYWHFGTPVALVRVVQRAASERKWRALMSADHEEAGPSESGAEARSRGQPTCSVCGAVVFVSYEKVTVCAVGGMWPPGLPNWASPPRRGAPAPRSAAAPVETAQLPAFMMSTPPVRMVA